jgi:L-fuconolactonase
MRIDAHQHFWKYHPVKEAWIDHTMHKIKRDFLPVDLHPVLQSNHFDGCVAVQADESIEETRFLLQLAADNDWIKGVVGWLDFFDPKLESHLDHFSSNKNFKGLRHILQAKPSGFILRPRFLKGIAALEQYGLTYDILVCHDQLADAISLVENFPNQHFVLNHIGKPKISLGVDKNWVSNINILSKHENVCCKISGMVTESENWTWQAADFDPFIDVVANAFGTDRLLFGSDWPVNLVAAQYKEVVGVVESFFKDASSKDVAKIMGLNAQRFYRI